MHHFHKLASVAAILAGFLSATSIAAASPAITQFDLGGVADPAGLVSDGTAMRVARWRDGSLARVAPDGTATSVGAGMSSSRGPFGVTMGPDGALWYTELGSGGGIGRQDADGTVDRFTAGVSGSALLTGITAGPDGALWFTEPGVHRIGRLQPGTGAVQHYALPDPDALPTDITTGPDGALWFVDSQRSGAIGRITTAGQVTEFRAGLTAGRHLSAITTGPDGALWFTQADGTVGRVTSGGTITEFATPAGFADVEDRGDGDDVLNFTGIATGPDGALWVAAWDRNGGLVRVTTDGSMTLVRDGLRSGSRVLDVAPGPDGAMWFTENRHGTVGRATVALPGADASGGGGSSGQPAASPALAAPAPGPALAAPELKRTVTVQVTRGSVAVRGPDGTYTLLSSSASIPTGSILDTTRGTVALTSALDTAGRTQTGRFWGGKFSVHQYADGRVRLKLRGAAPDCSKTTPGRARAAASKRKAPRRLWGKDDKGRFQTSGRGSVATVRGTRWLTEERCAGTYTRVTHGTVDVLDLGQRKTHRVRAGKSYLARVDR